MAYEVASYNMIGAFLRDGFTNMHGKPKMTITPLLQAMFNMRSQLRHEAYANEWIGEGATPKAVLMSSKLRLDKTIMIVYFPLIDTSMLFIELGNKINVVPCTQRFITSANDYDPASIYFYRIVTDGDNKSKVAAQCRCMYNINHILDPANGNITYGYLVAAYVDMLEDIFEDIEQEYIISYMIPIKENPSCNE